MFLFCLRNYDAIRHFFCSWCDAERRIPSDPTTRKVTRFILSDEYDNDDLDDLDNVPEDSVVVDEYLVNGYRKCVLHYEGAELHAPRDFNPFDELPLKPWIWIGDKTTGVDLTRALEKYLVPGNIIKIDLIDKLLQFNDDTFITYIDPRTFLEVKFPEDGVRINECP
jgi:hypothetical protein